MQNHNCKNCNTPFEISNHDLRFYEMVSPVFSGKKYLIPPPTLCPDCRQQRRLASCNEMNLYRGQCDLCKKTTLTQFPPALKQPTLCRECWHSDKWDPCQYGKDFDFSRPFFEQIRDLQRTVPAQALHIDGTVTNSDYMHYAGSSKNSYLIFHADFCEDCYYGYGFKDNTCCVDGFYNLHCELCYDCVDVHKCYGLIGSQDCLNCSSSAFLRDCIGCQDCFLCVGLRNKKYHFENKELPKEEYLKRISAINIGSYASYQQCELRLKELEKSHTFKEFHGHNTENCFGDYLINCKDTKYSFDCEDVEGGKFCYQLVLGSKNVYDIYQYGTNLQQSYEGAICGADGWGILFTSNGAMNSRDLIYCWCTEHAKNCFGCTSIHHKQYCILNKQYTEQQYNELVPKIIEHMGGRAHGASAQAERESGFASSSEAGLKNKEFGEFFPIEISSFGYNKTLAQMYYPMTREQVLAKGWKWDDYDAPQPVVSKTIPAASIPDNIKDISDEILSAAIECEITKKLFKIQPHELKFYKQQNCPLPRRHPDQRHLDRFKKRNPRKFWLRKCVKCQKEIHTTYSPQRPETVYCEKCYLETVY